MKIRIYLISIFLFNNLNAFTQIPNWAWATNIGGIGSDFSKIASDNQGNVYMAGYFINSTVVFGQNTLVNSGGQDFFLVKYDLAGNPVWAKQTFGAGFEKALDIAVDDSNNVYVTGIFSDANIVFGSDTLHSAGIYNMFLAKYDSNGNVIWARNAVSGSGSKLDGRAVIAGHDGFVYLTGSCTSAPSVNFGLGFMPVPSGSAMFVVKYDFSGNTIWARTAEAKGAINLDVKGKGVAVDGNSNVYVTGYFRSDTIAFNTTLLTNSGGDDLFVVRYDLLGNMIWAKKQNGFGNAVDEGNAIVTDNMNNIYVSGFFYSDSLMVGPALLLNADTNGTSYDIFIISYDPNGNLIWARREGNFNPPNLGDMVFNMVMDVNNHFYLTGYSGGPYIVFGNDTLNGNGFYIVKYDSFGNAIWAKGPDGSDGTHSGNGLCLDPYGNIYVTGYFTGTYFTLGTVTLNNSNFNEIFLAKLGNVTNVEGSNGMKYRAEVFPNPFSDRLNFYVYGSKNSEIFLYDLTSRIVLKKKFVNSISLNTLQLAKGIYFYEIKTDNQRWESGKVLKQ